MRNQPDVDDVAAVPARADEFLGVRPGRTRRSNEKLGEFVSGQEQMRE